MPTTPNYLLPYPLATDPADVPTDLRELAEASETALNGFDVRVDATEAFDPRIDTLETASANHETRLDALDPTIPVIKIAPGATGDVLTTLAGPTVGWQAGAGGGIVGLIQDIVLGANGPIDFTGIPQTFKHLSIVASVRGIGATESEVFTVQFNGVALTVISGFWGGGTATDRLGNILGASAPANRFAGVDLTLPDYRGGNHKMIQGTIAASASANWNYQAMGLWANVAAITRIQLFNASATFAAGSRATLYGFG
jgi:hypothetical protein